MSELYFDKIQKIKETNLGSQDKYIRDHHDTLLHQRIGQQDNPTFSHTVVLKDRSETKNISRFIFPAKDRCIYKNLRCKDFKLCWVLGKSEILDKIKYIELVKQAIVVDRIYPITFNVLKKLYNTDDDIPFHLLKSGIKSGGDIWINITWTDDQKIPLSLSFDVHTVDNRDDNFVPALVFQMQKANFIRPRSVNDPRLDVNLFVNHPVYYILIEHEGNLSDVTLKVNDDVIPLLKVDSISSDNRSVYTLTKSLEIDDLITGGINFSRINLTYIQVNQDADIKNIYCINSNIHRDGHLMWCA